MASHFSDTSGRATFYAQKHFTRKKKSAPQ
jgi:hypothetical protein